MSQTSQTTQSTDTPKTDIKTQNVFNLIKSIMIDFKLDDSVKHDFSIMCGCYPYENLYGMTAKVIYVALINSETKLITKIYPPKIIK